VAKKKVTAKKKTTKDKPADVLPGMPGKFVVMGLGAKANATMAAAIRKKLGG
jgi:hypothetical protein